MRQRRCCCAPDGHAAGSDPRSSRAHSQAFIEFFTATIRNRNTRMAYARAVKQFFGWCEDHHLGLDDIEPMAIATYIELLGATAAKPTVNKT